MTIQRKILFMEDEEEDLEPLAELLEQEGYQVLKALTLEEAKQILTDAWVHMMIVDLNMKGGDDDNDRSGLEIVNNPDYAAVPKVILTGYSDDPKVLRQMIKPTSDGRPLVLDFLGKSDGDIDNTLIKLFQALPINWNLQILWNPQSFGSILSLAGLISLAHEQMHLHQRIDELEDLLRKLFLDSAQLLVSRLFAYQAGVAWIEMITKGKTGLPRQFIVTCGQKQLIKQQLDQHQLLPYSNTLRQLGTAETLRFAATLYEYPSSNLAELIALSDFYLRWPTQAVEETIEYLFSSTLAPWHGQCSSTRTIENLKQLYLAWVPKPALPLQREDWDANLEDLCTKAGSIGGLSRVGCLPEQLTLYLSGEAKSYPNPVHFLLTEVTPLNLPFLHGTVHGHLTPRNILIDAQRHSSLIDFSQVREGPIVLDFVSLEAALKAELLSMADITLWCALERQLLEVKSLGEPIAIEDHSPEVQKMLKMVSVIRSCAAMAVDQSLRSYLAGLFVHSISRVAHYDKDKFYTGHELAIYLCHLISAAMICQRLASPREFVPNFDHKFVIVEGQKKSGLAPLDWQILEYLYKRAGQICTVMDILKEVYQDAADDIENGAWVRRFGKPKVTAAIGRLREAVEPNYKNPRYILTEQNYGYKLEL